MPCRVLLSPLSLATKQSPGLFLPNANAFGASCLLHCVQFTHRTLQIFNLSASPVRGAFLFVKAVGIALVFYICRISLKI